MLVSLTILLAAIVIIAIVFALGAAGKAFAGQGTVARSKQYTRNVKQVTEAAAQWEHQARQDQSPLISLMHANYALAYAQAAALVAPGDALRKIANLDVDEWIASLQDLQNKCMQRATTTCPAVKPEGQFALASGWIA